MFLSLITSNHWYQSHPPWICPISFYHSPESRLSAANTSWGKWMPHLTIHCIRKYFLFTDPFHSVSWDGSQFKYSEKEKHQKTQRASFLLQTHTNQYPIPLKSFSAFTRPCERLFAFSPVELGRSPKLLFQPLEKLLADSSPLWMDPKPGVCDRTW